MASSSKTTPAAKKSAARKISAAPSREEIALRAYHIFLERRGVPGSPFEDWTRAERELTENSAKPRRKPTPKSKAA